MKNTGHVAAREVRRHDPFFAWGTGVRGGRGSRLSVVRGGQPPGSGRLAPRCALVGKKGWDARMGLVVPPNRLRAALAARCPSVADGARDGSGSRRDGSRWERFEAACGSGRAAAGQRATRSALRSRRQERLRMRGWGSSCLRIGSALRSLPAVRRLLMGCVVGAFEAGCGLRRAADGGEAGVVRGGMGVETGGRATGERGGAEGGGLPQ